MHLYFTNMKHFYLFVAVLLVACGPNPNNSSNSHKEKMAQPIVTYLYDGNKEICLFPGEIATVDGQSGLWYSGEKDFFHSDGTSLQTTTRDYICIDYGTNKLIIWPGTGLVFFGLNNVNASFKNPSNDRIGKRCYRKR